MLSKPTSDHQPIILDSEEMRRRPTPFRFENMWLKEEGFISTMKNWWEGMTIKTGT